MCRVNAAFAAAAVAIILTQGSHPADAAAQQAAIDYATAHLDRRVPAARAIGPIALDGVLEEPAWAEAPLAHNFIQNDPREGEPATYDTEVRILYDNDAIYFGVFARDDQPARVVVSDIKKDFDPNRSDGFRIILDTFHDQRNAYQFATNPGGAKWDAQMANEGRENNVNWDGIWDVATRVTENGWFAEIRIPFRTLKFRNEDVQTWGVNFERKVRRLNEDSYWAPLPRIYDLHRVSMAGSVEELRGLRPGKSLRIKPFASSASSTIGRNPTTGDVDAGFDAKYGVTNGLVWDFTVNTDFSQVEADEQQVNLTRFNLLFPEKRDFFLENSGIFQFGPSAGGGGGFARQGLPQEAQLFFSRRIGLSDEGNAIPILAGTRLSGRHGAYSLGVLNIQQRELGDVPATNFTALRMRRNILAQSDISAMLLNKDAQGSHFNRVAGVDANFRFGYLNVNGHVARSFSAETPERAAGRSYAGRAGFNYSGRDWTAQGSSSTIGDAFDDEMGYIPRRGINSQHGQFGRRVRPQALARLVRETRPHWHFDQYLQQGGGLQSRYQGYHWIANFQDGATVEAGANTSVEEVPASFIVNTSRGIRVNAGRHEFVEYFAFWNTNAAARVSFNARYGAGSFYDGTLRNVSIGPSIRLNENFNATVNLQLNDIELPTGAFVSKLLTARVNYNFNTRMFFNALVQYNSDNQQWTSNLRFNIIHRPLSDFFLVYNERRDERTGALITRALIAKVTYLMAF